MNLCHRLEHQISVLGAHRVELTDTPLSVDIIDRAQPRVYPVDHLVDLHIGESCLNGVGSVNPERERRALGSVKLREPAVDIVCVADLHIFRE